MRQIMLFALTLVFVTPPALARESLWAERGAAAQPLAQVPDFAALAKQVLPAVVAIQVEQKVSMAQLPGMRGNPFEFFFGPFGGDIPREFRNRGLGSGLVIRRDGLILTNSHVVENAQSIDVTIATENGAEQTLAAKVLGIAPDYDVALIQIKEKVDLETAFLGDSEQINIGDWVMAVGNPFGLSHSVSVGIISAKQRREIMPSGRQGLYDFLQTDASINPGNSGGPLVNMRGEVIGINSAINAAGSGIGFAIPINMVKEMLPDLKEKGKFTKSWIGIRIQPLTDELADSYGLSKTAGALVAEVVPDSPADKAGVQPEDVVVQFDGKSVNRSSDLPLYASMAGVGKKVELKIWRKGKRKTVWVKLAEFPESEAEVVVDRGAKGGELGITVADVTPQLKRRFGLEKAGGVVVKEVVPGSPADDARIRPGDVVLELNGRSISTARAFALAVRAMKSGRVMRLLLRRGNGRLFVALRKP